MTARFPVDPRSRYARGAELTARFPADPSMLIPSTGRPDPRRAWAARVDAGHRPRIRAEADGDAARLYLYDPIDDWFGVTASDFVAQLDQLGDVDNIELRINCPGGDAFDGIAILNTLRDHPATVTAVVDGIAASAASFIAAGVDELVMMRNSELMIHEGRAICLGDAADMYQTGDILDQLSDNVASIYADKAGEDPAVWREFMRAETWYVDQEAVDAGLADRVAASSAPANRSTRRAAARLRVEKYPAESIPSNIAASWTGAPTP